VGFARADDGTTANATAAAKRMSLFMSSSSLSRWVCLARCELRGSGKERRRAKTSPSTTVTETVKTPKRRVVRKKK
jgi:hypothetical protein